MMFDANCPIGWTRMAALDGRFPLPASAFGTIGGTTTHNHSISTGGSHNHGSYTAGANRSAPVPASTPAGAVNGGYLEDVANQFYERASYHTHSISLDGAHNHGGFTGNIDNLMPPYITLIFCKKD